MPSTTSHRWFFYRAGGSDQVELARSEDLMALDQLDPKLWVALACPVKGLQLDERSLHLMDADSDDRIRVPEVIAAVKWAGSVLTDLESLIKGGDLPLASINELTPEGKGIAASARAILANLGKSGQATIAVADTMATAEVFAQTKYNGDGVVPVEMIDDADLKVVAERVMKHAGATIDRSGKEGIDQKAIDQYFDDCVAYDTWWKEGEADARTLLPLGERTPAAVTAMVAVRAKIDDYFSRCRLAAFDPRSITAVNRQEDAYLTLAATDLSVTAQELAGFPLARIEAWRPLPLTAQASSAGGAIEGLNPAWTAAIETFRTTCAQPIIGGDAKTLTEADWAKIQATLLANETWTGRMAGTDLEELGIAGVRATLAGPARAGLTALVAQDAAKAPEMEAISAVERLARYHRDLYQLLNNFVAFRDFYSRERPAVFQAGTLFLDGRSCDLCIHVHDADKHALLAGLSKNYLAYCDCRREGETMTIVAAFTDGDSDNLMVGRNGVFWDRQGRDWDATITKVVENPISIRQAFLSPYKKVIRLVEEQMAKRAAAGEAAADAKLSGTAADVANADKKVVEAKKIDVGTVAALGVAVGAIGTALATIGAKLLGILVLPFWQVILALAAVVVLISTPAMIIAWLKLRQRNLGPILDANGWAVNGQVKMNVPFGAALTKVATIPAGSGSSFAVKYPEPPTALPRIVAMVIAIVFALSLLNHYGLINVLSGGRFGGEGAAVVNPTGGVP